MLNIITPTLPWPLRDIISLDLPYKFFAISPAMPSQHMPNILTSLVDTETKIRELNFYANLNICL